MTRGVVRWLGLLLLVFAVVLVVIGLSFQGLGVDASLLFSAALVCLALGVMLFVLASRRR